MSCNEELLNEAIEALREAFRSYMVANCRRTLSMVKLTGQKRVRLEFYGLFRHYTATENFIRFMDAYSYIVQCKGLEFIKEVIGGEIVESGDEHGYYVVFDVDTYERLCREALQEASRS